MLRNKRRKKLIQVLIITKTNAPITLSELYSVFKKLAVIIFENLLFLNLPLPPFI